MVTEFCRKVALGSLIQGYFHNLRGALQGIYLNLQLLAMESPLEIQQKINEILKMCQKLQLLIESAFDEIHEEQEGPWNLGELLKKEILFWEGSLFFKHKIKKSLKIEKEVLVKLPLNILRGILCNIGEIVFPELKEGTSLEISVKKPAIVRFSVDKEFEEKVLTKLTKLAKVMETFVKIKINKKELELVF